MIGRRKAVTDPMGTVGSPRWLGGLRHLGLGRRCVPELTRWSKPSQLRGDLRGFGSRYQAFPIEHLGDESQKERIGHQQPGGKCERH